MAIPCIAESCFLIVGESHLDLIFELNVTLGDLVIHLAQFLEKADIGGGTDDFGLIAIFSALRLLSLNSMPSLVALTLSACLTRITCK
jgi:hypothetical protein